MRVFVAGATGALGKHLVPELLAAGHQVIGMSRTAAKADALRASGAEAVIADALNREAVMDAVIRARPNVVVHELTALAKMRNLKHFDREFEITNRLRTEVTEYLLDAAHACGSERFIAQSYGSWPNERKGGRVKSEDDPLDSEPPASMRRSLDAIRRLEQMVPSAVGLTGIVLRYGAFYGPGTSMGAGGEITELVRQRMFPVFGDGAGVWSFIHIADAARATRLAVEHGPVGIYNIVDDEPAEASVWLPDFARAIGAKPPYRLPAWIGRLFIGEAGVLMMTKIRGSSNQKASDILGWRPIFRSWRDGFRNGLSPEASRDWFTRVLSARGGGSR